LAETAAGGSDDVDALEHGLQRDDPKVFAINSRHHRHVRLPQKVWNALPWQGAWELGWHAQARSERHPLAAFGTVAG